MSLAKVGEYVGHEKLPMPDMDAGRTAWDEYCQGDVLILVAAMQRYWRMVVEWDLGNFTLTLASQAWGAYRHRFMQTPLWIDNDEYALKLSRKGYLGARTEAFKIGEVEERVYCLDINSQYPYVMGQTPVPTELVSMVTRTNLTELERLLDSHCIVADVTLKTTAANFPKKIPGWTIFPVGEFRTVLNTPELELAVAQGAIVQVHKMALYNKAIIFKDYVNFFWEKRLAARQTGDQSLDWLCKLFLNNLYGKTGQSGRKYSEEYRVDNQDIKTWREYDPADQTIHHYRQFAGIVEELSREPESRESFPAIAGHITSAARRYLLEHIDQAGWANTFYTDTDSLFVNETGFRNLSGRISDHQLGWLKHEWTSDELLIHGCKDYSIGGALKRKGVRANAETLGPNEFRQDQFRGLKGMVQHKDLDHMIISKVTKTLTREYRKGVVEAGGIVRPLVFPHPLYPD